MARLYADENVSRHLVAALRRLGYDVLTAQQDGRAGRGIPDPDVLARATQLGRAVLTNDRWDFHPLHTTNQPHDGIVTYKSDSDTVGLADRIHQGIAGRTDLTNTLVRIVRTA